MQLDAKKEYNVLLTGEEIALIQNALAELPFKFTAGLIQSLPDKISSLEKEKEND